MARRYKRDRRGRFASGTAGGTGTNPRPSRSLSRGQKIAIGVGATALAAGGAYVVGRSVQKRTIARNVRGMSADLAAAKVLRVAPLPPGPRERAARAGARIGSGVGKRAGARAGANKAAQIGIRRTQQQKNAAKIARRASRRVVSKGGW